MTLRHRKGSLFVGSALLAIGLLGCGDDSGPTGNQIIDTTPPAVPSGLEVAANGESLQLSWAPNSDADLAGYIVESSPDRGTTWIEETAVLTEATFTDTFASRADYRVRARDLTGNTSAPSAEATFLIGSGGGGGKIPQNQR